jgi:two-component sensor histidine kinase
MAGARRAALASPEREGFGSTLLRKVLPIQTKADVVVELNNDGLWCRIEAPLREKRLVPES